MKYVYTGEELHRGVRFPKIIEPRGKYKIPTNEKIGMPKKIYGYYTKDDKSMGIKEDEAKIIRIIFLYKEDLGAPAIAKKLNSKGYLNNGEKFTKGKIYNIYMVKNLYIEENYIKATYTLSY